MGRRFLEVVLLAALAAAGFLGWATTGHCGERKRKPAYDPDEPRVSAPRLMVCFVECEVPVTFFIPRNGANEWAAISWLNRDAFTGGGSGFSLDDGSSVAHHRWIRHVRRGRHVITLEVWRGGKRWRRVTHDLEVR
jgi:hypothetical protein